MTLHPVSGKVYATEMGRDGLGDNIPPDEINVIAKGKNFWQMAKTSASAVTTSVKSQNFKDMGPVKKFFFLT